MSRGLTTISPYYSPQYKNLLEERWKAHQAALSLQRPPVEATQPIEPHAASSEPMFAWRRLDDDEVIN